MRVVVLLASCAIVVSGTYGSTYAKKPKEEKKAELTEETPTPTVRAYVINMDSRPDKCKCMERQMVNAPHPVQRFSAEHIAPVSSAYMADLPGGSCDGVMKSHQDPGDWRDKAKLLSLFCSNFKVWKLAEQQKEDFVLIFEDDVGIKPNFWKKLDSFLQNHPHDWDFVLLDTYKWNNRDGGRKEDLIETWKDGKDEHNLYKANDDGGAYWGAHAQLVRKDFLGKLIKEAYDGGPLAMDHWLRDARFNAIGGRLRALNLGVTDPLGWKDAPDHKSAADYGCESNVALSDIGFRQKWGDKKVGFLQQKAKKVAKKLKKKKSKDEPDRLTC